MKYKKSGRVTALLLSAVLTLCLLPLPVRAAGAETASRSCGAASAWTKMAR